MSKATKNYLQNILMTGVVPEIIQVFPKQEIVGTAAVYTRMNEVMKLVKQYDGIVLKRDLQLFCSIELAIPKNKAAEVLSRLKDFTGIEIAQQ